MGLKKEAEEKNKLNCFISNKGEAGKSMATPCAHAQLIDIYVSCRAVTECAAPLSRSQRSLIRADTGRGVTQDLALAGQYWPHLESC